MSQSSSNEEKLADFDKKFSKVRPLFDVPVIKDHLAFLKAAFLMLYPIDGDDFIVEKPATCHKGPSPVMHVFLSKAVYRFQDWVTTSVKDYSPSRALPPLDVLLVLLAYQLSPCAFTEDAMLRFPQLTRIGPFPLKETLARIHPGTGAYTSRPEDILEWKRCTRLPFNVEDMAPTLTLRCPFCHHKQEVRWADPQAPSPGLGKGYGELAFAASCSGCRRAITRDALCVRKFVSDLIACQENQRMVLARTLFDWEKGLEQHQRARTIVNEVISVLGNPKDNLGEKLGWSMTNTQKKLEGATESQLNATMVEELLRPYQHFQPFSADLTQKATLQGDFALYWYRRGWFKPTFSQEKIDLALQKALQSYEGFLKLLLICNTSAYYPPQITDLVWHTHQLRGMEYRKQSIDLLGMYVDHLSQEEMDNTAESYTTSRRIYTDMLAELGYPALEEEDGCECGHPKCVDCAKRRTGTGASPPFMTGASPFAMPVSAPDGTIQPGDKPPACGPSGSRRRQGVLKETAAITAF